MDNETLDILELLALMAISGILMLLEKFLG